MNKDGDTALHTACRTLHDAMALMGRGADMDIRDNAAQR
jgi:hypothetical protein